MDDIIPRRGGGREFRSKKILLLTFSLNAHRGPRPQTCRCEAIKVLHIDLEVLRTGEVWMARKCQALVDRRGINRLTICMDILVH